MGQVLRKLKSPSGPADSREAVVSVIKRQSVDLKPPPPEARVIIEPDQKKTEERSKPDPNFVSMSQKVVGTITTRPAVKAEKPNAVITEEYTRQMPVDRHTSLLSGPDEDTIQSPGTLNHTQMREIFLLYQGKGDGQSKPLDVETLAKRFNIDAEILQRVFRYTSLVHFEKRISSQPVDQHRN